MKLRALFSSAAGRKLYQPSQEKVKSTHMTAFAASIGGPNLSYADLHKWSIANTRPFWAAVADYCAVKWIARSPSTSTMTVSPSTSTMTGSPPLSKTPCQQIYIPPPPPHRMRGATWFKGYGFNFAQNLLPPPTDEEVLVSVYESGACVRFTGRQLHNEVARCSTALRQAGVTKGDRVAGVLTNSSEAIICMLATTALGAIWSSCSPDFGVEGVRDRLSQVQPKALFMSVAYRYNGKRIDCTPLMKPIKDGLPSVKVAVAVPYLGDDDGASGSSSGGGGGGGGGSVPYMALPAGFTTFETFLGKSSSSSNNNTNTSNNNSSSSSSRSSGGYKSNGHVVVEVEGGGDDGDDVMKIHFEPVPFDHPVYIMFSSGTTGLPKCIVHGGGGTLLQQKKELMLHCDVKAGDRLMYYTTTGWMMWNWMCTTLSVEGVSLVTYDGSPAYPKIQRLWELAEKHQLSHLGLSPKYLTACMAAEKKLNSSSGGGGGGDGGGSKRRGKKRLLEGLDLSRLRCVLSTGSPLLPEHYEWVYDSVKSDVHLASISGGTDIMGCFMLGNPNLPVHSGEIQCLGLGMDVQAYDEETGRRAKVGEKAELVCATPFVSMPLGFWGDDEKQTKYHSAYFERSDGALDTSKSDMWYHGDFIEISEHGGVIVHGRSDATLNPGGVRIGTAEIYRTLEAMAEVEDAVAVGHKRDGDEDVVLFVKLVGGPSAMTEKLALGIKSAVRQRLTPRHVPRHVIAVADIPYTRSGKKVEVAVTKAIHGERVKNVTALANPECLTEFYAMEAKLKTLTSKL